MASHGTNNRHSLVRWCEPRSFLSRLPPYSSSIPGCSTGDVKRTSLPLLYLLLRTCCPWNCLISGGLGCARFLTTWEGSRGIRCGCKASLAQSPPTIINKASSAPGTVLFSSPTRQSLEAVFPTRAPANSC